MKKITQQREKRPVSKNFTLIEILIVCALIAMLTALAVTGFSVAMQKASEAETRSIIAQIEVAMDGYKAKYGFFPPSDHAKNDYRILQIPNTDEGYDLSEFIPNYEKWKQNGTIGTYHEDKYNTLYDPYGNPFWFYSPGFHNRGSFDIESAGPDGYFGYLVDFKHSLLNPDHDPSDSDSNYSPDNQADNIKNWRD